MALYLNNTLINLRKFPAGETHIRIDETLVTQQNKIALIFDGNDDLINLMLLTDAIRKLSPKAIITLEIYYFPYARQDRVCETGESFSLKVIAGLINSLGFEEISVYDPHSDVTPALLDNTKIITQDSIVKEFFHARFSELDALILAPDAGAEKKAFKSAKLLGKEFISASKIRCTKTGNIIDTKINGDISGKNLIIIDDICDGGRTFIELAKKAKEQGANDIYLYVTHGIFSNGFDELKKYMKHIYCFHNFFKPNNDKEFLTIIKQGI